MIPFIFGGGSFRQANALHSRTVTDVKRYGKVFYLELDGDGPMPVLHFGMTGNILVSPACYRWCTIFD